MTLDQQSPGVWARVPADTPEAVAKLKIRTYDKTGTELFKALGATASVVSFTDLPAKLTANPLPARKRSAVA